ncbi:MAG: NAD-dependent epimerase/dehydratase family protein [Ilumatobacteraceae bacterium]
MTTDRRSLPDTTVVTGAAGWLGRALVDHLLGDEQRTHLRLLAHDTAEAQALRTAVDAHPAGPTRSVEIVIGDVSRPDTARRLLHGVVGTTDVIHTAGIIHPRRVRQFTEVNATGARNVAEACRDLGVRRLVHVSSNSPFGTNPDHADTFRPDEPYNPYLGYGISKMQAEVAVLENVEAGLDASIVRPPWFYGPFQPPRQTTFFRMVRTGRFPVIGDGSQRRSMAYVGNLVDGIVAAELVEGARGRGYWIADAPPDTVTEIVETVGRALSDEGLEVTPNSTRLPVLAARVAETADRVLQAVGLYQQQLHVLGEMGHTIACDVSRSVDELGWEPRVALYEGMRNSIRWCLAQGLEL